MPRAPRRVSRATTLAKRLCDVSTYRLLAPVPMPRLPSVGNVEGSRAHHWLPWPSFGCPSSVGRGSEPLPCTQCNFLHHATTKGTSAHRSNAVFTASAYCPTPRARYHELRRTTLPRTPVNRASASLSVCFQRLLGAQP